MNTGKNLGNPNAQGHWAGSNTGSFGNEGGDGNLIFDTNGDSPLTADDDVWALMKVWRDHIRIAWATRV
ncbi:hypothetical protein QTA57_00575 [Fontisubflavum oceani]|uniref:hypothetical protein n=1 Tax=Fontisubflavum oceani TaxID=2978973 RepID=UPI0025B2FB7F|nr:hypothetical protein [Fontisubflavum oceani]WJY21739.1 hypothetical protein QTA57_00575 [Fontisubflavum oceani]